MLKSLFCKHNKEVICWHITHGPNGDLPAYLEIQVQCKKCGKYFFEYIKDTTMMNEFIKIYKDKEWSSTCKPVIISKHKFFADEEDIV